MGSAIIAKHSTWKTPFSKPTMTFQHLPIFSPLYIQNAIVKTNSLIYDICYFERLSFDEFCGEEKFRWLPSKNKVDEFFFSKKFRQMKSGQNNNMILQKT